MSRDSHTTKFALIAGVAVLTLLAAGFAQAATITHRYDFESDNGDDSAGVVNGTIEGGAAFTNDAAAGSRAIQLDGTDDLVNFPAPMDFGSQFSLATWVKPQPGALGIQNLLANAEGGWATNGFKLYYNTWSDPATADNVLILETGNGAGWGDAYRAGTVTEGAWNHVVATVDTVAAEVHIYVDGSETPGTGGLVTDMNTNLDWEIGRMVDRNDVAGSWNLAGIIDDVQVYSGVLTANQARFLFNNPGAVIPEPSAIVILLSGALGLLLRRRRHKA